MSYCRFNGEQSDVYCYSSGDRWHIHVARNTGLHLDGNEFTSNTRSVCLKTLFLLREVGYKIPDHPIERLKKEIEERKCNITRDGDYHDHCTTHMTSFGADDPCPKQEKLL